MLRWLAKKVFGKQASRTAALEGYLALFNKEELAYLNDITLSGISMIVVEKKDPYPAVDLASYVHTAWLAAQGEIENTIPALAAARSKVRMGITKAAIAATKLPGMEAMYASPLSNYRSDIDDIDHADETRLGLHSTMLTRIYRDGFLANTLPELDEFNEGQAWNQRWRDNNQI